MASLKITLIGSTDDDLAGRVEREARRRVHPRVRRDHRGAAHDAGQHDRDTGPEVGPGLQALPAEDVDGDEDRLGEEEQPLERERDPERLAPLAHEPRPQQPELEAQHRAGHRADRERDRHVLRPPLGQEQRVGVVVAEGPVVGDQRHERPRHPERHEDDVEREGERHLRPGPRHRVHREHAAQHDGSLVIELRPGDDHVVVESSHRASASSVVDRGHGIRRLTGNNRRTRPCHPPRWGKRRRTPSVGDDPPVVMRPILDVSWSRPASIVRLRA